MNSKHQRKTDNVDKRRCVIIIVGVFHNDHDFFIFFSVKLSMSAEYFARFNCDEGLGSPASSVVSDPIYQIRSRSWVSCESMSSWGITMGSGITTGQRESQWLATLRAGG